MKLTFKQFLLEYNQNVGFPDTDYGYWIVETGEILPAFGEMTNAHLKTARQYIQAHNPGLTFKGFGDLMQRRGWVRIVEMKSSSYEIDELSIEMSSFITSQAMNTLKSYILDRAKNFRGPGGHPVVFNLEKFDGDRYENLKSIKTSKPGTAISFCMD